MVEVGDPPIQLRVAATIPARPADAFARLLDCDRYHDWWPLRVRAIQGQEGAIEVRPLPGVRIVMVQQPREGEDELTYAYLRGPLRGTGTWRVRPVDGGTEVEYTIRLRPVNALIGLLAATPLFRFKHGRDVRGIIRRLGAEAVDA